MTANDTPTPAFQKVRAVDVRPYRWGLWCTVGDDPRPFVNVIESRSWDTDGQHIWFLLGTHNFRKAKPDDMLDLVPCDPGEWADKQPDDTAEFLAKRPVPMRACATCDGKGKVPA